MHEVWKPVVGFESSHEVSSEGRVRTIERTYPGGRRKLDGSPSTMSIRQKVLSTRITERGYVAVDLSCDKRRRGRGVHCVVAEAFLGPAPSGEHQVNHIDGNKLNNRLDNLEWLSPQENSQHAWDTGLRQPIIGEGVHTAKLDEAKVREVRKLLAAGMSQRAIARRFGVANPQIHRIATGKAWKHVE